MRHVVGSALQHSGQRCSAERHSVYLSKAEKFYATLSVTMTSSIMLRVITLNLGMLNDVVLAVTLLTLVMLGIVQSSVSIPSS
jgi:hypothetical protein